jgi:RNA polymerase sigma-70 factor (ECF subfamily)
MTDPVSLSLATDLDAGFSLLVDTHQHLLFGVALRLCGDASEAEEIAQDALVNAYRALTGWTVERRRELLPRPWLCAIVLNVYRGRLRRRRPTVSYTEELHAPATYDDPDLGDHAWTRRLAALPDRYRVPIVLHCIEDLSYEETAEALDRPVGTVKAQIHRGLTGLREMQLDSEAVR